MTAKKKRGRPRTRPPDLEPFTAHLSVRAKRRLLALAQITDQPAYRYMEEAFWMFWENLPDERRKTAETLTRMVEEAQESSG
jgi:hypothetical protein